MTEPVNFNKFREAKARAEKEQRAAENRVKFGRTKAEKARDRLEADHKKRDMDQSQLDD